MIRPIHFLRLVEHIRNLFEGDAKLCATVASLCSRGVPRAICSAAVATLVNCGFLRWTEDDCLQRADTTLRTPTRRTA